MTTPSTTRRMPLTLSRGTLVALLVCALATTGTTTAGANMASNASFETGPDPGEAMTLAVGATTISGWIVTRNPIEYVGTRWNASDGTRSIALNGSAPGGLAQTIATVQDGQYTVHFWMAGDAFSSPLFKHMRVEAAGQSQDYEFDASHSWPWGMGWLEQTFLFTAATGSTTIEFSSLDTDSTGPTLDQIDVTGPTVDASAADIHRVTLDSPRPNPATGTITMDYALPFAGPVRLSMCDLQGREIHVFAEGLHPAGRHSEAWDFRAASGRVPAGVYFVRLSTPGASLVRKVVLSY